MFKFFKYSIVVYVAFGIFLALLVDGKKMQLDHLNFFKGIENRLAQLREQRSRPDVFDLQEGLHFYREVGRVFPDNALVRANLGYCYYYLGDYFKALKEYQNAIRLEPDLYVLYMDAGEISSVLGDSLQASAYFTKARSLLPVIRDYYVALLEGFKQQGYKRGFLLVSRLVAEAENDQRTIIENLIKGYEKKPGHNTIMDKAGAGRLHFFTVEEASLFGGLKHAAKK